MDSIKTVSKRYQQGIMALEIADGTKIWSTMESSWDPLGMSEPRWCHVVPVSDNIWISSIATASSGWNPPWGSSHRQAVAMSYMSSDSKMMAVAPGMWSSDGATSWVQDGTGLICSFQPCHPRLFMGTFGPARTVVPLGVRTRPLARHRIGMSPFDLFDGSSGGHPLDHPGSEHWHSFHCLHHSIHQ